MDSYTREFWLLTHSPADLMVQPNYFNEKRYSYHVYGWVPAAFSTYQAPDLQTTFEKKVQALYTKGYEYLSREENYLALNTFRELQNVILTAVDPTVPLDLHRVKDFVFPLDATMIDAFAAKVGRELQSLPLKTPGFPDSVLGRVALPEGVAAKLMVFKSIGLTTSTQRKRVVQLVREGLAAVERSSWAEALSAFKGALQQVPANDSIAKASILHDLSIISEKAGHDLKASAEQAAEAVGLFGAIKEYEAQVHGLITLAGIQTRLGDRNAAVGTLNLAAEIVNKERLFPVAVSGMSVSSGKRITPLVGIVGTVPHEAKTSVKTSAKLETAAAVPQASETPILLGTTLVARDPITDKVFRISATASAQATLRVAGDVIANVKSYLQAVAVTDDLSLVHAYDLSYVEILVYLTSMYFFAIPMAIGDCFAGLGNYAEAAQQYLSALASPFINRQYEVVKLWNKLAGTYLDLGDQAYRNAKDDVEGYATARPFYEKIVRSDKTLDPASPLYQDARFAQIKVRVQNFIKAGLVPTHDDNPVVLAKVLEANVRLNQIQLGLNFFGFAPDYSPPFSFEYLQNTSRYLAEQASHIEQRYIQFKSAAENETLQREQLDQQAEVGRQTVLLEQRGVTEAQAGLAGAQANLQYAKVQERNAVDGRNNFKRVRDELLELSGLEAWANAASVNQDDEVKLSISNYSYYNTDHKRRSLVVQDLEHRRTKISHDLEASRLDAEVASATAFKTVAESYVRQAQARVDIARQRVSIAQLQRRDAEENRVFMDLKEFSARLWYDLAKESKRITGRYLDMATEMAFLTERAYNAETERGLSIIHYDYRFTPAANLLGADRLLADLDSFTVDMITTTRTKKAPVKRIISLADSFPMAFQQLKTAGSCNFQTSFATFDREASGMYLCKMRYVELLFIGIANVTLAGTLRNGGISSFRRSDGSITTRLYPADVLPLSAYDMRQDALAFRVNPNELRLFENNGIETHWQIDLPRNANDFDYEDILDVQLVMYYDGFFSPTLEQTIKGTLPLGSSASRALSLRMMFPDELFYLRSNGEAQMVFDESLFPRNQKNMKRTKLMLKATGTTARNLTLHISSKNHGSDLQVTTDADGLVEGTRPDDALGALRGEALLDTWTISIAKADNPGLGQGDELDSKKLTDIMLYFEYDFQYR